MVNIQDKANCCGCQACGDVCPKDAITFKSDEEGIWYPVVAQEKCIDCGLCEKVCPILSENRREDNYSEPIAYVLQAIDPVDRLMSASGAAYTLIARAVFAKGGIVAGHVWKDDYSVRGYVSGNPDDLEILRGTKYLQSDVSGLYRATKSLLLQGRLVLFSGTPCQNAALRCFLRKDYDNLITTDFVCMGIDSPMAFERYIRSLESMYNSKVVYFKAKSKEVGWRYLTNKAVFENGRSYFGINGQDANLKATFLNTLVRPSCYNCRFRGFPRHSDITIGDYWRPKPDNDPIDDNTGTSYALLHNKKAEGFFEEVASACNSRRIDVHEILKGNKYATRSLPQPLFDRSSFYRRIRSEDFRKVVDEYYEKYFVVGRPSVFQRMKALLKDSLKLLYYYRSYPGSLAAFVYYNFLCRKVKCNVAAGDILYLRNVRMRLAKGARIEVHGACIWDSSLTKSFLSMGENAVLHLDSNQIGNGNFWEIAAASEVSIGFKTIVKDVVRIKNTKQLSIGAFSLVGDGVVIDDTDAGVVLFKSKENGQSGVKIGTHVLLNQGAVIRNGAILDDEAIVDEYSVVEGRCKRSNVNWKHDFDFIWNYKI